MLIVEAIGFRGVLKAMKQEAWIYPNKPKVSYIYFWFIGVDPTYQHSGIGSHLLKKVLAEAESQDITGAFNCLQYYGGLFLIAIYFSPL
jgi:ribosomal protein S18 acetylase RimI-like enzyme